MSGMVQADPAASKAPESEYSQPISIVICACGCGRPIGARSRRGRLARIYASDACRARVRNRKLAEALAVVARQRALPLEPPPAPGWTPAERELAHAMRSRETKAQRVLARLRLGPATTWELAQAGGFRFSARLQELEADGLRYEREDYADHSVYTMTREPGE